MLPAPGQCGLPLPARPHRAAGPPCPAAHPVARGCGRTCAFSCQRPDLSATESSPGDAGSGRSPRGSGTRSARCNSCTRYVAPTLTATPSRCQSATMQRALVLGSGFSAAMGLPTVDRLFPAIFGLKNDHPEFERDLSRVESSLDYLYESFRPDASRQGGTWTPPGSRSEMNTADS